MHHIQGRQLVGWLVAGGAVACALFWIFYFPYRFQRLAAAIPVTAEAVSYHENLADRWRDILRSPLASGALVAGGQDPATVQAQVDEKVVDRLLGILGRRPAIIAYVPHLGAHDRPAIVVAAWAGGYTQLLRWGWFDRSLAEFRTEALWKRHTVWRLDCPDMGPGQTLALAGCEGVVAAVLSDDPSAIGQIVSQLDWQSASPSPLPDWLRRHGAEADRVVWRPAGIRTPRIAGLVQAGVGELTATTVAGACSATVAGLHLTAQPAADHLASLPALLGAMPAAGVMGALGALAEVRRGLPGLASATACLTPAVETLPADTGFFVAISDGAYSGRIKRIRVPALWCGIRLPDGVVPETIVRPVLDILNAHHNLGLVPLPAGDAHGRHLLTSTTSAFYAKLARGERAAYAVQDGWLIVCSSFDALQTLLDTPHTAAASWAADVQRSVPLQAWADCARVSSLAGTALAGYTLYTLYAGFVDNAPAHRIDTDRLKRAIAALQQLGKLQAHVSDNAALRLEFRITR
jgi:hypothetical protein